MTTPPARAAVSVAYGTYFCGACGEELLSPAELHVGYVITKCGAARCSMFNLRLRIPLLQLTCEVLPS